MTRRLVMCALVVATIAFQPFVDASAYDDRTSPYLAADDASPAPAIDSPDTDAPPESDAAFAAPSATPIAAPTVVASAAPTPAPTADASAEPETGGAQNLGHENARPADKAGYLYSYAVDENRYDDIATSLDAYKPFGSPAARIRPYVAALLTRDTRSGSNAAANGGPPLPLILADNYGLGSLGLQYTTPGGLRLFGQVGRSFTIGPVAAQPSGNDARGGVQLYREWGPAFARGATYGNFYGSIEYLSRYSDTISYDQVELVHNAGSAKRPVEFFGRAVASLDTQRHYYANIIELTAGIRVHPFGIHGPIVSVEQTGGTYVRGQLPVATHRTYLDFRPTVSYGFNI